MSGSGATGSGRGSAATGPSAESEALARYRAAARDRRSSAAGGSQRRRGPWRTLQGTPSGPGPDARDPQRVGEVWRRLADGRGWTDELALWSLANRWPQLVGPQVAEHVAVVSFDPRPAVADEEPGRAPEPVQGSLLAGAAPPARAARGGGGTLTLMADSSSWRQEMVWNLASLQRRLDLELGAGVVSRIVVQGPATRARSYGPRRARR